MDKIGGVWLCYGLHRGYASCLSWLGGLLLTSSLWENRKPWGWGQAEGKNRHPLNERMEFPCHGLGSWERWGLGCRG